MVLLVPGPWDVVLVALAAYYGQLTYFRSGLFVGWRAYFEARGGRLGELMTCPVCLAFWNCAFQVTVLWLPVFFLPRPLGRLYRLPQVFMALAGAVLIIYEWQYPED